MPPRDSQFWRVWHVAVGPPDEKMNGAGSSAGRPVPPPQAYVVSCTAVRLRHARHSHGEGTGGRVPGPASAMGSPAALTNWDAGHTSGRCQWRDSEAGRRSKSLAPRTQERSSRHPRASAELAKAVASDSAKLHATGGELRRFPSIKTPWRSRSPSLLSQRTAHNEQLHAYVPLCQRAVSRQSRRRLRKLSTSLQVPT